MHVVFLTAVLNIKEMKFSADMKRNKEAEFLSPPRKCEIFSFVFSILIVSQRNYYERRTGIIVLLVLGLEEFLSTQTLANS